VVGLGGPFYAGAVISTMPDPTLEDGESIDWQVLKRCPLEGSYSSRITVASTTDDAGRPTVIVSGNPAKWYQGHNVFGSDDLPGLVREMLHRVCESRGLVPSPDDLAAWDAGAIELLRVDVTYSYDLGNRGRVRNALRALDATAHLRHRGRGQFYGDALTWGGGSKGKKGSRRWSLTAYAKGPELDVHGLPMALAETSIKSHADALLRFEVRMLSMELKREELHRVSDWSDNTAQELHARKLQGLQVSDSFILDASVIEGLPGRLQLAYQAWRDGHDLRATLPRRTFYRYRTELLKHGIDLAVKQERPADAGNVVPLRVVLVAQPVSVPDWAIGTPLYFEPRAKFG
jgi:II/X family phage/plasmid replication protein